MSDLQRGGQHDMLNLNQQAGERMAEQLKAEETKQPKADAGSASSTTPKETKNAG